MKIDRVVRLAVLAGFFFNSAFSLAQKRIVLHDALVGFSHDMFELYKDKLPGALFSDEEKSSEKLTHNIEGVFDFLKTVLDEPLQKQEKILEQTSLEVGQQFVLDLGDKNFSNINDASIRGLVSNIFKICLEFLQNAQTITNGLMHKMRSEAQYSSLLEVQTPDAIKKWLWEKITALLFVLSSTENKKLSAEKLSLLASEQAQSLITYFFDVFKDQKITSQDRDALASYLVDALVKFKFIQKSVTPPQEKPIERPLPPIPAPLPAIDQKKVLQLFWKWHAKSAKSKLALQVQQLLSSEQAAAFFSEQFDARNALLKTLLNVAENERNQKIKEQAEVISRAFIAAFKDKGASELIEPKVRLDVYRFLNSLFNTIKITAAKSKKALSDIDLLSQRLRSVGMLDAANKWIEQQLENAALQLETEIDENTTRAVHDARVLKQAETLAASFITAFEKDGFTQKDASALTRILAKQLSEAFDEVVATEQAPEVEKKVSTFEQDIIQGATKLKPAAQEVVAPKETLTPSPAQLTEAANKLRHVEKQAVNIEPSRAAYWETLTPNELRKELEIIKNKQMVLGPKVVRELLADPQRRRDAPFEKEYKQLQIESDFIEEQLQLQEKTPMHTHPAEWYN